MSCLKHEVDISELTKWKYQNSTTQFYVFFCCLVSWFLFFRSSGFGLLDQLKIFLAEFFWKNCQRQQVVQKTIERWRGQLTSTKPWTLYYPDSASMASASLILVALTMASCRSMSACVTVVDDMRGWSGFRNEARSSLPWKLKSIKN